MTGRQNEERENKNYIILANDSTEMIK